MKKRIFWSLFLLSAMPQQVFAECSIKDLPPINITVNVMIDKNGVVSATPMGLPPNVKSVDTKIIKLDKDFSDASAGVKAITPSVAVPVVEVPLPSVKKEVAKSEPAPKIEAKPETTKEKMERLMQEQKAKKTSSQKPTFPSDVNKVFVKHNCMACHSVHRKVVGPAYKKVAEKYKGVSKYIYEGKEYSLEEGLAKKIAHGGSGVWGSLKMPENDQGEKIMDDIKIMVDAIMKLQ